MKEKRTEKCCFSDKIKKKKKHKKKTNSSSDHESTSNEMKWIEASPHHVHTKIRKKKKKHKKKQHKSSSSDSESLDVKSDSTPSKNIVSQKRECWMNEELLVPTLSKEEMYSSSRQRRLDSLKEQQEREEKIQKARELNPHWKEDGTGLPNKETSVESLSLPSTSVGDGGYSWLKKAYYRIQEQAQQEGRSMEEIAVERWGSLSKLTTLIEEAEQRMKSHPDLKNYLNRQYGDKYDYDKRSRTTEFRKPSYTDELKNRHDNPHEFKKPTDNKSFKVLNQFKSSKRSKFSCNFSDDIIKNENTYFSNPVNQQLVEHEDRLISETKNSKERKDYIPAWKKPKYSEEKLKEVEISKGFTDGDCHPVSKKSGENMPSEIESSLPIYSEDDLNKLAARQIKAEMMGDASLAVKLKQQLEEARKIVKKEGFAKHAKNVEEVVLTKIDSRGQVHPIQITQEISAYKQKKTNKYFDDDSKYSLKQMFEREKSTTADDQLEMFVEASAGNNEASEIDFELGNTSKKLHQKLAISREEEKDIGKAIRQHQKFNTALEKCCYCLDQPRMKKHLIVNIGEQVYLCLPNFQTLADGHCLIVPKVHVSSFLSLDENEWQEVDDFKNNLRKMFKSQNKSVIFLETSMNFRYYPHAVLECIPVPEEEGDMAPFYFKKAIQESEAEWAHNKKLIDLTNKGLRYSVPKNLPYFHVEFDPKVHSGYAHVIEEEKYFPCNFGKEVVGGMLDIDYNYLYKNKKEDPVKKCKEVVEFQKMWSRFKDGSP